MKRLSLTDIVVSSLVVVLITVTLAPALGRAQRSLADSKCQSNLRRWAEAMSAYTCDNNSCYPTNRANGTVMVTSVPLSQQDPLPGQSQPPRFQYGVNWVEALYPYIQKSAASTGQDWKSFRRCPNARDVVYPPSASGTDFHWAMSYVFNGALVEQPAGCVHDADKLMMIRELGRLTVSTLRPTNQSCVGSSVNTPISPFLNSNDSGIGNTSGECQLHGGGSYILFADGHVDHFTMDFFPENSQITTFRCWDPQTMQWWNFGPNMAPPYEKSIAITP